MHWSLAVTLGFTALASSAILHVEPETPVVKAPLENPWKVLSDDEVTGLNAFLRDTLELGDNQGSSKDSYVVQLALLPPNKTDVVPYLDSDGPKPNRYARATVQIGATGSTDKYWQEYMVGPLPITNSSTVEPLTWKFHNEQPGKTPIHAIYSANDTLEWTMKFAAQVEDITMLLWNTTFLDGTIGVRYGIPFWEEDGRIVSWLTVLQDPGPTVSSSTVLPLGVAIKLDLTSRNWEDWAVAGWYSRGVFYASTEEFRAAIISPDFKPLPVDVSGNWTSTDKQGEALPLDDLPPPVSVSQGSQRFKVDTEAGYIEWMDFSFYHTTSWDTGLSLFNIQYQGKRLLYELSLQDALTAYAGSDPFSSQQTFFDTQVGMGSTLQPLVKGYDCPHHATYLNATWTEGISTTTQPNAICLFEFDTGYPIRRHSFSPAAPHTSVAKNIKFVLRTIATVGNYDFMIEYNFFYDGAIEIHARASGYISAAYWEGSTNYGFHIHDYLSGSLHDHALTFKADFDILGCKNSIQKIEFVPISTTYPWSQGRVHHTFTTSRSFVANESESSLNFSPNDSTMFAIVNTDKPNRFGEFPGYRMKCAAGTVHMTAQQSSNILNAGKFTTHDFYVTKMKDEEPRCSDPNNFYKPEDPLVDFGRFLDGEGLEGEDLVIWFNLGTHHMPHTGDLPNTMFSSAHSAMRFEPLNYLEGDPSVRSNQQIRIDFDEEGSVERVEEFGKVVGNATGVQGGV